MKIGKWKPYFWRNLAHFQFCHWTWLIISISFSRLWSFFGGCAIAAAAAAAFAACFASRNWGEDCFWVGGSQIATPSTKLSEFMDEKDDDSNVMSSIMYRHTAHWHHRQQRLMALFSLPPLVNSLARDLGTLCKSRAIWHWTTRLLCKENSTYCCYLCSRSQAGRMLSLRAEMTLFSAICICVFLVKYHSFSFWLNDL